MASMSTPGTTTMLLPRLAIGRRDKAAWVEFVNRYGAIIYDWCRRYGLQDADAQDVTQAVFTRLLRLVGTFDRSQGRARDWLCKVVRNQVYDWRNSSAYQCQKGTEAAWEALASEPAAQDLEARLGEKFDLELLEAAEREVQLRVSPHVWKAYWLRYRERLSLKEAAERCGMPVGNVGKNAIRVWKKVAERVAELEEKAFGDRMEGLTDGSDEPPAD